MGSRVGRPFCIRLWGFRTVDWSGATWPGLLRTGGDDQRVLHYAAWNLPREFALGPSLRNSRSAFDLSSGPDPTDELSVGGAGQCSDLVLNLATRVFPQVPDLHAQTIPRLCYGVKDKEGCTPLMVSPSRFGRRWTECSFSSNRTRDERRSFSVMWWGQLP